MFSLNIGQSVSLLANVWVCPLSEQAKCRGVPEIEVTFDLDANGILNVTARDKASGSTGHVTITNKMKGSDEEVKRMCADAERFRKQDEEELQRQKARNSLQEYIFSVKDAADQLA